MLALVDPLLQNIKIKKRETLFSKFFSIYDISVYGETIVMYGVSGT